MIETANTEKRRTEKWHTGALVQRLGELVDGRGHLQAVQEDGALTLDLDVEGPLHETREVGLVTDGTTDTPVARALLNQACLVEGGSLLLGACGRLGGSGGSGVLSRGWGCFLRLRMSNERMHDYTRKIHLQRRR